MAIFHNKHAGGFWVEFPEVGGCCTHGENLEEALQNAQKTLSGMLNCIIADGKPLPLSSTEEGDRRALKGDNVQWIPFDSDDVLEDSKKVVS